MMVDLVGLEAPPTDIQQAQQPARPISDRPICLQSVEPAKKVLQLETRPVGRGDGCLPPGLDRVSVRQPTMSTNTTSADGSSKTEGQSGIDCPSLEVTSVVPVPTNPPDKSPNCSTSSGKHNITGKSTTPSNPGSQGAVGHMAYIRRSCEAGSLSEEATRLLIAEEISVLLQLTLSQVGVLVFSKGPIFGPVGDIVNFLVELFEKGYSYRSFNSYWSAISSVHDQINGVAIRQYPMVTRALKGVYNSRPPKPR